MSLTIDIHDYICHAYPDHLCLPIRKYFFLLLNIYSHNFPERAIIYIINIDTVGFVGSQSLLALICSI